MRDDFRTSEACCKSDTANHCGLHTFAYRSAANAKQRNDSEKHAMCASSCSSQCPNSIFLNQWRANTHTQSQEQRWSKYVYSICLTGLPIASLQLKKYISSYRCESAYTIIYFYIYPGHPRPWKYPQQWIHCNHKNSVPPILPGIGANFWIL